MSEQVRQPAIRARGVVKRWGQTIALAGASFEVGRGITGLLGPNGAGKTTLIECILGLHALDGGTLEVEGVNPVTAGPQVRARIGYAPEHDCLPPDDRAQDLVRHLAEIHGIPRKRSTQLASDALHLVGLGEERFRPIGTMSTGQKQRVKLAAAIAHDPSLVLLDEPTNGLDPVQRDEMLRLVREIGHVMGMDVILASHLLGEVERVADHVVALDAGSVVMSGEIDAMHSATADIVLEVDGQAKTIALALRAAGLRVRGRGYRMQVGFRDEGTYDEIRDAVAETGAGIRRLGRAGSTLEDAFLHATGES